MEQIADFIRKNGIKVPSEQQNTLDIEGYYFTTHQNAQIAMWECFADKTSRRHTHAFNEYMICLKGEYTAFMENEKHVLKESDDLFIPKGKEQWGMCKAGTITIHFFDGLRF